MKPAYSVIIPVYNRPDEINELLSSLALQSFHNFEVVIVEDGSDTPCMDVVEQFKEKLCITYFAKPNTGQSDSRNVGIGLAKSDFFIFFDSDCIIPADYLRCLDRYRQVNQVDAYGGPDAAHPSFSSLQKAINFSMTSFLTTGGIRGGKKQLEKFTPRSFNMGFSREVFNVTKGYGKLHVGEDIDLSFRIRSSGFDTALIRDAYVYHKRRLSFKRFWKQVFKYGEARLVLNKLHPGSMKLVHLLPALFTVGVFAMVFLSLFVSSVFILPVLFYAFLIFVCSFIANKSLSVAFLSIPASYIQLIGYGCGFLKSVFVRGVLRQKLTQSKYQLDK